MHNSVRQIGLLHRLMAILFFFFFVIDVLYRPKKCRLQENGTILLSAIKYLLDNDDDDDDDDGDGDDDENELYLYLGLVELFRLLAGTLLM